MSEVEGTDGRLLADRYRLGAVLGKGGMGTVWSAVDETLGRSVAVKELRFPGDVDDEEKRRLVTRTLREAKATARIRNSGAITVFDVVKEDDRPWIVMELVEGRSLSDAIREDGPLTPRRAAEVGLVVLDVLRDAHREGILHRDVKPSNVMIADSGSGQDGVTGGGRVVLGDFGIAQIDGDPSVTSTGMLVGAPSYISPERARGQKPGPPADLWSLGALLYASVEGHPPYDKGSAIATLTAVMTEPVGPMKNAGPLAEVIRGLLIKDPEQRLTEPAARALLATVAKTPERPVAPPPLPVDSPTTLMPVAPPVAPPASKKATPAARPARAVRPERNDPQPTPSDAPPEILEAAAAQIRVREALRSVRKAATRPRPAPEPGTPENAPAPPARAPLTDVVPRRTLIIVAVVLAIAVLATIIGIAASGGGGGDSKDTKGAVGTSPSVTHSAGATGGSTATSGSSTSAADQPSAPATSAATGDDDAQGSDSGDDNQAATAGTAGTAGTGGGDALPAGYHAVSVPNFHFAIALPDGWKKTRTTSTGVTFSAPGGFPQVLIDTTKTPGKDAAATWRENEPSVASSSKGYSLLGIKKIDYRGYPTAADWDFYRTWDGTKVWVQNRGFVVDPHHGFAIMTSIRRGDQDSPASKTMLQTFYASFTVLD